ncbi:hypothetical protein [Salinarimonas rosea]|uniref:hypothetical protein n=1 Tax=Salinarimonas rosea TaxID=552063 RepID=UPI00041AD137|nr:hypothetical protein [Salinarimonas rosea]
MSLFARILIALVSSIAFGVLGGVALVLTPEPYRILVALCLGAAAWNGGRAIAEHGRR